MRMLERRARGLAVILEEQDVFEARVLLQIDHALAEGQQHIGHLVDREAGQRRLVIGTLDDDLVGADPVHAIEQALARGLQLAFDAQRGNLLGTTRYVHPGESAPSRGARPARISDGVCSSWPGQKGQIAVRGAWPFRVRSPRDAAPAPWR